MREKSKFEEISQGLIILYIIYFCCNYFFGCNESEPTMLEKDTIYHHLNTEFQEGFDSTFYQKTIYKRHSDSLTTLGIEILYKQKFKEDLIVKDYKDYKVKRIELKSEGISTLPRITNNLNDSYKDSLKK